jgi:hypothetical protein
MDVAGKSEKLKAKRLKRKANGLNGTLQQVSYFL